MNPEYEIVFGTTQEGDRWRFMVAVRDAEHMIPLIVSDDTYPSLDAAKIEARYRMEMLAKTLRRMGVSKVENKTEEEIH